MVINGLMKTVIPMTVNQKKIDNPKAPSKLIAILRIPNDIGYKE
jgi:hypothetical protein